MDALCVKMDGGEESESLVEETGGVATRMLGTSRGAGRWVGDIAGVDGAAFWTRCVAGFGAASIEALRMWISGEEG